MNIKARKLNIIDLINNKKDILWGKDYFGQFKKNKLINYLIFGNHQNLLDIKEIFRTDTCSKNLIDDFVNLYAKKTKYFIRELDELRDLKEIEVMRESGFMRFNRNYCFDFDAQQFNQSSETQVHDVYCREITRKDFGELANFDRDCQIMEYRDVFFRNKVFFENNLNKVFIFSHTNNLNNIVAYALKKEIKDKSVFEIIMHPTSADLIHDCIIAFAEKYVFFEKFDDNFFFIVNDNLKTEIEALRKQYALLWSNQILIKEGNPRTKIKLGKQIFNFNSVTKTT